MTEDHRAQEIEDLKKAVADALVATLDPTPTVVAPGGVAVRRVDSG